MNQGNESIENINYCLFFDSSCPLCISTVGFIKRYIKPVNLIYLPISESSLKDDIYERALKEMLLITPSGNMYWGYETYRFILRRSGSLYSYVLKFVSFLMGLFLIRDIGIYIYNKISLTRNRCDDSCEI